MQEIAGHKNTGALGTPADLHLPSSRRSAGDWKQTRRCHRSRPVKAIGTITGLRFSCNRTDRRTAGYFGSSGINDRDSVF